MRGGGGGESLTRVLCGCGQVSIDLLEEKIIDLEDLVQSVDIAAMNKI